MHSSTHLNSHCEQNGESPAHACEKASNHPLFCFHMIPSRPVVRPLGRSLMTVSNSLSICVLAFAFCFTIVCRTRSSLVLAILSSLVRVCLGKATASNISSLELLVIVLDRDLEGFDNPLRVCIRSLGVSSTAVVPERLKEGEFGNRLLVDDKDLLCSFLSRFIAKAALPSSHSCIRLFRSVPIESYWASKSVLDLGS